MKPDLYRQRLAQSMQSGQLTAASAVLDGWQTRIPNAFEPQFHRIQLHAMSGEYRAAHELAVKLGGRADCPPHLAAELVACLKSFALHDVLIAWAEAYVDGGKLPARDSATVAVDLSAIGAHRQALPWAERGVAQAPNDPVCLVNRALILSYLGNFEQSRADLRRVIAGSKHSAMAHWLLSRLDRQTPDSNHVPALRAALQSVTLEQRERAFLGHALFKELDDLGEHADAWSALQSANQCAASDQPYLRGSEEQIFRAIKRAFASSDNLPQADPHAAQIPLFIVGLHRSGTSLIERIIGADPAVFDLGETERLAAAVRYAANVYCERVPNATLMAGADRLDYPLVGRQFNAAAQRQSSGHRFVTEKAPGNFLNVGIIRRALPQARIIHMRREPIDLCFANYRELFGQQVAHSNSLDDLVHYHRQYEELMRHWHAVYPGFILDVHYERLVRDPQGESRRVFEFCGLDWSPSVVEVERRTDSPVATLSSVQVRKSINTASIDRWRPYSASLSVLRDAFAASC